MSEEKDAYEAVKKYDEIIHQNLRNSLAAGVILGRFNILHTPLSSGNVLNMSLFFQ